MLVPVTAVGCRVPTGMSLDSEGWRGVQGIRRGKEGRVLRSVLYHGELRELHADYGVQKQWETEISMSKGDYGLQWYP